MNYFKSSQLSIFLCFCSLIISSCNEEDDNIDSLEQIIINDTTYIKEIIYNDDFYKSFCGVYKYMGELLCIKENGKIEWLWQFEGNGKAYLDNQKKVHYVNSHIMSISECFAFFSIDNSFLYMDYPLRDTSHITKFISSISHSIIKSGGETYSSIMSEAEYNKIKKTFLDNFNDLIEGEQYSYNNEYQYIEKGTILDLGLSIKWVELSDNVKWQVFDNGEIREPNENEIIELLDNCEFFTYNFTFYPPYYSFNCRYVFNYHKAIEENINFIIGPNKKKYKTLFYFPSYNP